jgi:hypothetical protein
MGCATAKITPGNRGDRRENARVTAVLRLDRGVRLVRLCLA